MSSQALIVGTYLIPQAEQPVILVELWIETSDTIDFGRFRQADHSNGTGWDQVAYDEHLLNEDGSDGQRLLMAPLKSAARARVAFFMHYPDFSRPLETPVGPIKLPRPTTLPDRLAFIEYLRP